MRFLKIFIGVVIFLLAAIAGLVFYAERLDWNAIRPEAEKRISAAAGRKFEITGDLDFTFFPRPRVSAGGLRLANADWGSEPTMLTAKSVTFVIAPLSILTGYPLARSMTLNGVDLLLERNNEGQSNWDLGGDDSSAGDQVRVFTKLRSVTADDVNVTYKSPNNKPIRFEVSEARLGAKGLGPGLGVDIRGTMNDKAFSVSGSLRSVSEYFGGGKLRGKINVQADDVQATLDGNFGRPPNLVGSEFAVHGKGDRIPRIATFDALPEDMRGPWQADLTYTGLKNGYQISGADVHLTDYRFQGDLGHDHKTGYNGNVVIEAPDYKLHLDGQLGSLTSLQGIDASVAGSGTGVPAVGALASFEKDFQKTWEAELHLRGKPDRVEVSDLKLKVAQSDLAGAVTLDRSGMRPRVEGKVTSEFLNIGMFRQGGSESAGTAETEKPQSKKTGPVFSDEPIPLDWLKSVDGSVEVQAKQLQANFLAYQDVLARATLNDGKFQLVSERGMIYGAQASGMVEIDASETPPRVVMQSRAHGADVGKITGDWSDPPFMTGQGDFELDISANGDSLAALMDTLSGEVKIIVGEGRAEVGMLDRMVKTIGLKTIGNLLGQDKADRVPMNCFAAHLGAESGVVKADVLVMDTKHATIFGSGTIDLRKEQYDLVFKPKPKSVTLNTAVPIKLGGTFRDPTVSAETIGTLRKIAGIASLFVFPPAAIAGLADFGVGDNQCVKLAAQSK